MKRLISILILVLLISGCAGFPNIFGQDKDVKEASEDVVTVENVNVLPVPPITAGDQFSVSFQVTNMDEDQNVDATYELLDAGLCKDPVTGEKEGDFGGSLVPGQVEFVEWTFDTPESQDIAYIKTICPVRFRVTYRFNAQSEIEVNVISDARYRQLQQSGTFETFTPTLTMDRGPIKIDIELGATMPLKAGSLLPVYLTVYDKGQGLIDKIPFYQLVLGVPGETVNNSGNIACRYSDEDCFIPYDCTAFLRPDSQPTAGYTYYVNNMDVPLMDRKTYKMKCSFRVPDIRAEHTYFFDAYFLEYYYDVLKQVDVEVKPLSP